MPGGIDAGQDNVVDGIAGGLQNGRRARPGGEQDGRLGMQIIEELGDIADSGLEAARQDVERIVRLRHERPVVIGFEFSYPQLAMLDVPGAQGREFGGEGREGRGCVGQIAGVLQHQDAAIEDYFRRYRARFDYEAHAMAIGVRQALELLDAAFAQGYDTPEEVKAYLLSVPVHQTSLGPIAFDGSGDVGGHFFFLTELEQELQ